MQAFISVWISFVMLFVNFVPGFVPPTKKYTDDKAYPYIFVHGFLGWGRDEGINEDMPYWGATACNLIDNIRKEGYECYAASVGPMSSNWDRACELYAQLTGTTVDYGEAHSQQHNHARYGRTYEKPMIKGWGKKDKNGLKNKVNLIGHSFGGNTVRLLQGLLADGAAEEVKASGKKVSPLFKGGKGDWINAVVTICSPNNGTTMAYIFEKLNLIEVLFSLGLLWAGFFGRSPINGYFDFHLEQFGLTNVPEDEEVKAIDLFRAMKLVMEAEYDNVAYDLSPEGAQELNRRTKLSDNVYYFSYAFTTTKQIPLLKTHVTIPSTLFILIPFGNIMGIFKNNDVTDYPIDEEWLENDGLVNLISAKYPFDDPHTDYNHKKVRTGIWNVMPVSVGDHGNAIGIGVSEDKVMEYYLGMIDMIECLPVTK